MAFGGVATAVGMVSVAFPPLWPTVPHIGAAAAAALGLASTNAGEFFQERTYPYYIFDSEF